MALKVLLADESTTIKKAFQLALSDLGVEIKSVPSGLDVVAVSLDFKPDIIFADILLTKKSGYVVCKEVKSHPDLKHIPVILMWSQFMEMDSGLAEQSGYSDKLEKPSDSPTLREKVTRFVPKTDSHPLKGLLKFPDLPQFVESETMLRQKSAYLEQKNQPMPSVDDLEIVTEISQPKAQLEKKSTPTPVHSEPEKANADHSFDSGYDIQIETENYGDFEEVVLVKTERDDQFENGIETNIKNYIEDSPVTASRSKIQKNEIKPHMTKFDEQLMREEIKMITEKICWQIIPELAEKVIREEIAKLMKNIEKSI